MLVKEPVLAHQFDTLEQQRDTESFGIWAFLATEILIFGALFAGYSAYRVFYDKDFEAASAKLSILIGAVNTAVLLTSSLTMALAVYATRTDKRNMMLTCLVLTAILGAVFMGFKAREYYKDWEENLVPGTVNHFDRAEWTEHGHNPEHVQLFLMFYYCMTGLHAVHLTIGIGLMLWLYWRGRRGDLGSWHYMPVEVCGLYWHFVDVIWIFLLPLLYLIGTHGPGDLAKF